MLIYFNSTASAMIVIAQIPFKFLSLESLIYETFEGMTAGEIHLTFKITHLSIRNIYILPSSPSILDDFFGLEMVFLRFQTVAVHVSYDF